VFKFRTSPIEIRGDRHVQEVVLGRNELVDDESGRVVAQDTGGAIKGRVRADFYWGIGDEAGALAGRMKQPGRLWVLLPRPAAE